MSAFKEITQILSEITSPEEIEKFLMEILTENERRDLSLRWDLMRKLHDGISQRAISTELGISLCRITRGSKILKSGDSIINKILNDRSK
ncbi:MAG TPA: Trp family transcriptional regulator [Spirochaetota bacterium]|nr:Trp family transcriptional regulator [Spirochaetota bacterium]